jgi:hypothetical protein
VPDTLLVLEAMFISSQQTRFRAVSLLALSEITAGCLKPFPERARAVPQKTPPPGPGGGVLS